MSTHVRSSIEVHSSHQSTVIFSAMPGRVATLREKSLENEKNPGRGILLSIREI